MARLGLDYSFAAPISPAEHRAVGSSFAIRYLNGGHPKALTKAEVAALHGGKISIVVVYESLANRALAGRGAGVDDANAALNAARALGVPGSRPIYFAVDFDATASEQGAINEYFRGIHSVFDNTGPVSFPTGTPVGVYAGYYPLKRLFDAKLVDYGYQTYAWSGRNVDKRAALYQYSNGHNVAGHAVDFNHALKADFGQWPIAAKPVPVLRDPSGRWAFKGWVDMPSGAVHIQGAKGSKVRMGQHNRRHHFDVSVGEEHGHWEIARK